MHVLVPFDESDRSTRALEYALDVFTDAEVTVLHVLDPGNVVYVGMERDASTDFDEVRAEMEEEAEQLLAEARDVAAERGAEVSTTTRLGEVPREIVDHADESDVDHVVMGTHGRTGARRILLGSHAEEVVRRAPVPVTTV